MAYVNNGQFRAKELSITIDGTTSVLQIKDEFSWDGVTYPKILTDTAFARLPLQDGGTPDKGYTARLEAFYEYAENLLGLSVGDLSEYGYREGQTPNGFTSNCVVGNIDPTPAD